MSLLFSLAIAATCQQYSASCQCSPAVPFEGYQISFVEVCDGKEEWHTQFGERQYSTMKDCQQAILEDSDCQRLSTSTGTGTSTNADSDPGAISQSSSNAE